MNTDRWVFGETVIERVLEMDGPGLEPFKLLPELSQHILEEHRHWLEPHLLDPVSGRFVSSFHSFVLRTPRTITVVDTCAGNDKDRPNRPRYHMKGRPYLQRLAAIGVRPEDVNYVLCTHLHTDHVGWNTRLVNGRWVPTFPNATYLTSRPELDYWSDAANRRVHNEDLYYEDSILPVLESGQVVFVEDGFTIDKGVTVVASPGHTPGHVCVRVVNGNEDAVMSGDILHNALQVVMPSLNSFSCVDAELARKTRREFVERCFENGTLVMPAHFPKPTAGRIVRSSGAGFRFRFDGPFGESWSP